MHCDNIEFTPPDFFLMDLWGRRGEGVLLEREKGGLDLLAHRSKSCLRFAFQPRYNKPVQTHVSTA